MPDRDIVYESTTFVAGGTICGAMSNMNWKGGSINRKQCVVIATQGKISDKR